MKGVIIYNQVQSLLRQSKSQRQISLELRINIRTVTKLSRYDIEEASEYFKQRVQRRSGFDFTKPFIEDKLITYIVFTFKRHKYFPV